MSRENKCTVIESMVIPCRAMESATEGPNGGSKARGIYVWATLNIKTGKGARVMYGAVTRNHPKGLIFNYCPWCGSDLKESHSPITGDAK